jgi:hypothetical protein
MSLFGNQLTGWRNEPVAKLQDRNQLSQASDEEAIEELENEN